MVRLVQAGSGRERAADVGGAAGAIAWSHTASRSRTWLQQDHLQLTRVQELLGQHGVHVPYTTLRRFVRRPGLQARGRPRRYGAHGADAAGRGGRDGFRAPGHAAQPGDGQAPGGSGALSRHADVQPPQLLVAAGRIRRWRPPSKGSSRRGASSAGCPSALVLDNFPAAVAGTDALNPRPTRAFLEYSQARGFLLDPARVRQPKDKPQVERFVQYARGALLEGRHASSTSPTHAARPSGGASRSPASAIHGTTHRLPLVVFEDEERAHLLPYDGDALRRAALERRHRPPRSPRQRPVRAVLGAVDDLPTGHQAGGALRSRRWSSSIDAGELVKVHPRKPKGGRSTDADDYPPERTAYAMRAPDRLVSQACALGPHIGQLRRALAGCALPLVQAAPGPEAAAAWPNATRAERLDAACARALGFDLVDVRRLERILVLALEHEGQPAPPRSSSASSHCRAAASPDRAPPSIIASRRQSHQWRCQP